MKISKQSLEKLKCLNCICEHSPDDSKCLYNKLIEKDDPNQAIFEATVKLFEKELEGVNKRLRK